MIPLLFRYDLSSVHTNTPAGNISGNPDNRRSELRRPATGSVQLRFEGEPGSEVDLDLMDVSSSGYHMETGFVIFK
ncbi:MAG TPA: hypothetical protein VN924_02720 [Bryobacteraceae bacterium]|jgi:hypothetical protein|nr:hypothetical protein [Bryobacteraceae bacterium]